MGNFDEHYGDGTDPVDAVTVTETVEIEVTVEMDSEAELGLFGGHELENEAFAVIVMVIGAGH